MQKKNNFPFLSIILYRFRLFLLSFLCERKNKSGLKKINIYQACFCLQSGLAVAYTMQFHGVSHFCVGLFLFYSPYILLLAYQFTENVKIVQEFRYAIVSIGI